ncbi:MAG: hypothetical protein IPM54_44680 [Polyangiaceae bacterium]|nr:hypothetical protein [Polyangiaceae bacterium]
MPKRRSHTKSAAQHDDHHLRSRAPSPSRRRTRSSSVEFEHFGLRVAFGALRPKPRSWHAIHHRQRPTNVAQWSGHVRAKRKGAPIELGDATTWDQLRVEIGLPRWGVDFNDDNYPQEASLEHLGVSFQKGCYLGQEAVFMLQMRGHVKKKIVRLEIDGVENVPAATEIALPDSKPVGTITSTASSPVKPSILALGYVKWKQREAGTELLVAGRKAVVL